MSPRSTHRRSKAPLAIVVAILVVAALIAALLFVILPNWIIAKATEAGRAQGLQLEIDSASVLFSRAKLHDVRVRIPDVPQVTASFPAVIIELARFRPEAIRCEGGRVLVDAPALEVMPRLSRWMEQRRSQGGGSPQGNGEPSLLTIEDADLVWKRALSSTTQIESKANLALRKTPAGDELRALLPALRVAGIGPGLGPWRLEWSRAKGASMGYLALDPNRPTGPHVQMVERDGRFEKLQVNVDRAKPAALGLPPLVLGLSEEPSAEIAADVDATSSGSAISGKGKLGLYAVRLGASPVPVDAVIDGTFTGEVGKPLEVKSGTLYLGPFAATVSGTIAPSSAGLRADLAWQMGPKPCAEFATAGVPPEFGALAQGLGQLAQGLGLPQPTGELSVAGRLQFDSANPGATTLSMTPRGSCGLSLFGGR